MSTLFCPEHPKAELIEDGSAGDLICPQCGLVVGGRVVDVSMEWRHFENGRSTTDPARVGAPENPMLAGPGLGTLISRDRRGVDWDLQSFVGLQKIISKQRRMGEAADLIQRMADRAQLPRPVQKYAMRLYKSVLDADGLRRGDRHAQAAACLYVACRMGAAPRTFKEICAVSNASKRDIGRCFKKIVGLLEESVEVVTGIDFMSRFCGNLGLPKVVQEAAICIAKNALHFDLVAGKSPVSIAAASIYLASQASAAQCSIKEVADISGASATAIRHALQALSPRSGDLFPTGFEFAIPLAQLELGFQ